MNSSIYTVGAGMAVQRARLEAISNNLANVSTTGYKADNAVAGTFPEILMFLREGRAKVTAASARLAAGDVGSTGLTHLLGITGRGAVVSDTVTDFKQGTLRQTGRTLDLALQGEGFFTVEAAGGRIYTRDGAFNIDRDGYLVTSRGHKVMGENGPIRLPERILDDGVNKLVIDEGGKITADGYEIDCLLITRFANKDVLTKYGDNYFIAPQEEGVPMAGGDRAGEGSGTYVKQGFLEDSNTDLNEEMVNMMSVMRAYEAGQKFIQAEDELAERAANRVGIVN